MQGAWRVRLALAAAVAMTPLPEPVSAEDNNREPLIGALQQLQARLFELKTRVETDHLGSRWEMALIDAKWLHDQARLWKPSKRDEGKHLVQGVQLLSATFGRAPRGSTDQDSKLLREAFDNLDQIALYCRRSGLAAEPTVMVRTKSGGRDEVKGLEVLFLEKFVATVNPNAKPHRFSEFSSPVKDKLLAGRYWFWARDPNTGKAGPVVEGCVCDDRASRFAETLFKFEIRAP
jgi:hypothetical protein